MESAHRSPVVFLDRDGVLIENRPKHVRSWEEVEVFDRAVQACRMLSAAGYLLIVVTNQSIVGKGILSLDYITTLNERIVDHLRNLGAPIHASYLCPHHPDAGCDCRKPQPGMILEAAREHGLDLQHAFLVGDAITDLQAAEAAGVKGILVRTGRGAEQESLLSDFPHAEWPVCKDLLAAARLILSANEVHR